MNVQTLVNLSVTDRSMSYKSNERQFQQADLYTCTTGRINCIVSMYTAWRSSFHVVTITFVLSILLLICCLYYHFAFKIMTILKLLLKELYSQFQNDRISSLIQLRLQNDTKGVIQRRGHATRPILRIIQLRIELFLELPTKTPTRNLWPHKVNQSIFYICASLLARLQHSKTSSQQQYGLY